MKYVMTEAVDQAGMSCLTAEDEVFVTHSTSLADFEKELHDADVLIVRAAPSGCITRQIMEKAQKLRVIGRTGVGYDSVDIKAATELGIPVVLTPGANNRAVAEHTLALMLAVSKNLVQAQMEVIKGNWQIRDAGKQFELYGKTVGIIGLGRIGRNVAELCKGIGMKVAAYDPFLTKSDMLALGYEWYADVPSLIKECDVISLHVPLTPETRGMISKREFTLMKPTAILINCARGGIVNETDLIEALNAGQIAGAGLDVFEKEKLYPGDPLLDAKNLTISPHSAAQTREAVKNMAIMCIRGCQAVCRGERWEYVADKKVYEFMSVR